MIVQRKWMMNKYLARGKETPTETYLIQIQIKKCLKYKDVGYSRNAWWTLN
jgi:hypothetical protein